jgi:hypothetical protein
MSGLYESRLIFGSLPSGEQSIDAVAGVAEDMVDTPIAQALEHIVGDCLGHDFSCPFWAGDLLDGCLSDADHPQSLLNHALGLQPGWRCTLPVPTPRQPNRRGGIGLRCDPSRRHP